MKDFQTINGLMRHMRDKHGIDIQGSKAKHWLINYGYYHSYKGYRFFNDASKTRLPLSSFSELKAIVDYDNYLKQIMYSKIMFIETAFKNISLQYLLEETNASSFAKLFDIAIPGYAEALKKGKAKSHANRFQNKIDNSVFNSLSKDTSIQQIEFKFFVDYIILTTCILKKLGISKNELKLFVNSFINGTENFRQQIPASLFMSLCGSDCNKKSKELHNYIKI